MDLITYQTKASATAVYPRAGYGTCQGIAYVALGLTGEAGEVANQVKKIIRDDDGDLTSERRVKLISEAGDVLWYLAQLCTELSVSMEELAQYNLDKLNARARNGTLKGDARQD